jgi:hypothetical protein
MSRQPWWPARFWPQRTPRRSVRERGYDAYVDELSQRLYRQTVNEGGAAVDIGIFGPELFKGDARRLVHEIALGSAGGDPLSP